MLGSIDRRSKEKSFKSALVKTALFLTLLASCNNGTPPNTNSDTTNKDVPSNKGNSLLTDTFLDTLYLNKSQLLELKRINKHKITFTFIVGDSNKLTLAAWPGKTKSQEFDTAYQELFNYSASTIKLEKDMILGNIEISKKTQDDGREYLNELFRLASAPGDITIIFAPYIKRHNVSYQLFKYAGVINKDKKSISGLVSLNMSLDPSPPYSAQ